MSNNLYSSNIKRLAISIFSLSFLAAFSSQTFKLSSPCVVEMANRWLRPEVRSDPQLLFHNTFIVLTKKYLSINL